MSRVPADKVCGLILAAGRGRRFGGDKLLATFSDGSSVIERVVRHMSAVVTEYVCVVRADDQRLQAHLEVLKAPWISIDSADLGMSQSLIAGVNYFSQAQAWLIGLGDMPYVSACTYELICQRYFRYQAQARLQSRARHPTCARHQTCARQQELDLPSIVVPEIQCDSEPCKRGNPVLFSRHFFSELQNLTGDVGGRRIIAANAESVLRLPVEDAGILQDVDVPQDILPTA